MWLQYENHAYIYCEINSNGKNKNTSNYFPLCIYIQNTPYRYGEGIAENLSIPDRQK